MKRLFYPRVTFTVPLILFQKEIKENMTTSYIEIENHSSYNTSLSKTSFEVFFTNPEEKDRVLDNFHEALGSGGYSFSVANIAACGGITVQISLMKVKGQKQISFKNKSKWLNFMKRILISATKDLGYMLHSAAFDPTLFSFTAGVSRENK